MIWLTNLSLLFLVIGSCHGNPVSKVQERAGGFMEFGDIPGRLRGVCKTVLNVESVLTTFPLSLVSGVVFTIPLPIPNPLILDPLRLYEFSINVMTSFQDTINGLSGDGKPATSRKRDLSYLTRSNDIDLLQEQLSKIREKMDVAFAPFNFQKRSITEREAEDPGKPGYLLNFRNVLDIVEYLCPLVDLTESFFKTSFLGVLQLYRIPLPVTNGEPVNILTALDIWNIRGGVESFVNSVGSLFGGGVVPTTPAPAGFLGALFGSAPVAVTTPAPSFIQGAISSVGSLFGLFGGSSAPSEPEVAAAGVQHDEVMEVPEEPEVMVAVVPPKVTTIAPAKLNGSLLGINLDWLFGNDAAKPIISPISAIGFPISPSSISATTKASVVTTLKPTTKVPVTNILDTLFGSVITASSTSKPSLVPIPTTIAASSTTPQPTTKSPIINILDNLFGGAVTTTSTTKPSIAPIAASTTTRVPISTITPTSTTPASLAAKALLSSTTTTKSPIVNILDSLFGNPATSTAASTTTVQANITNAPSIAAKALNPMTATTTTITPSAGGLNILGWKLW